MAPKRYGLRPGAGGFRILIAYDEVITQNMLSPPLGQLGREMSVCLWSILVDHTRTQRR